MAETEAALSLQERVRTAIGSGESHFREFKSALEGAPGSKTPRDKKLVRRDIGEALVAFANADGGELVVGVEDDGALSGIPHNEEVVSSFLDAWKTHVHAETPLPRPRVASIELDTVRVLYFSVEKSASLVHLTNDGRCLQRHDRETVPVPSEQIRFDRQERLSREYDRTFVDGGTTADLDLDVLDRIGEEIYPGVSPEKVLQLLELAEFTVAGIRLRRAAVLLLGKEIQRWHPRCEVRVLRVDGTELKSGREYNVVEDKVVSGCILELLSNAWEEIRPYLVQTRLGPEGRFEEQIRYPEDACREALTNAIAHRDYSMEGRAIEVFVFDDRLEFKSPGPLLSGVTVDGLKQLQGLHQSRNTMVARTLRELRYMREMGEGFRRIFHLMRAHDLVEPELSADAESFVVSLQHRSVFSEEDQRWIAAYEFFELERDEEKVLLLGRDGNAISVQQIMDALDLVDTEDYRALIERLQSKGLIQGKRLPRAGRHGKSRTGPRWRVIQPKQASEYLGDLVQATIDVYRGEPLARQEFNRIYSLLRDGSPYLRDKIASSLRALRLIGPDGAPAGRFQALLEAGGRGGQASTGHSTERSRASTAATDRSAAAGEASGQTDDGGDEAQEIAQVRRRKLYVGNLPWDTNSKTLSARFASVGQVKAVSIPRDVTRPGRSRGFAFVEMSTDDDARRAKQELHGSDFGGRRLLLDWARS